MSDIFLSFSGDKSQKFAEKLEKLISEIELGDTFLANKNIRAGDKWLEKIYKALKKCRIGIIILTKENRNTSKWLYIEYGILSYKNIIESDKNLKLIPVYLDFSLDDKSWKENNPINLDQAISFFNTDFEEVLEKLCLDINHVFNLKIVEEKKDKLLFRNKILESKYKNELLNILNEENTSKNIETEPNQANTQQEINLNNHIINKTLIAQVLQHINNFITQNQCILYNHIEYDKLEKHLEEKLKLDEVTLANAISYLSDNNHIIFTEEEDLDGYPIEYIGLSIQGQKVVRRRNRRK